MCYNPAMKKLFLTLICLFSLLPTVEARFDADQLLGGLLSAISEPQPTAGAQDSPQTQPGDASGSSLTHMVRAAAAPLMDTFKEEGREYAKEVGDLITNRILESRKISDTLDSMRFFCWAVCIYLTIVTVIIIVLLLRLRALHTRLMQAVNKLTVDK